MERLQETAVKLLKRPALVLAPVAVLVFLLALATNVVPLRQIVDQRQDVADSREKLESLESENANLKRHVDKLGSDLEVERLAREQLGYVRPGETAFVVIDPEPATPLYPEDFIEAPSEQAAVPWYVEIWRYMTGSDLGD